MWHSRVTGRSLQSAEGSDPQMRNVRRNSGVYYPGERSSYSCVFEEVTLHYDKPGSARWPTALETCRRLTECSDLGTQRALSKQQRGNRAEDRQQPGTVAHHHRTTKWQATYGAAVIFDGWTQRGTGGFQWRRG